ncbi:MAG TPA: hypothetical protein DEA82_12810 [Flavobacteriaceae bacterium]|nr:hypothetical protein [Flavobacteriaceae bacterium]MAY52056.1 hypothetical protein [Flavobacteriaceae bacterium]HBR55006.1 hypothetical protein [Flavobacteriaceae bacterium]
MKFKSIFFLVAFTWCILTPAVVTLCKIDTNMATLFSMNEEETSETFKLGPKEYNAPDQFGTRFLSIYEIKNRSNFEYRPTLWESPSQETLSPPPEHS